MSFLFLILLLVALITVIKVLSQISRQRKCPSDKQLKDAVLGRHLRSSQKSEDIITHLGTCAKCRDKVEGFIH